MLVPNRRSRLVRWLAPDVFTTVFRVLWIVAVVYAEIGTFYLAGVRWPDASNGSSKPLDKPTHVLLVADTKVTPPADGRRTFRQILDDAYLRKAWSTVSRSRPQIVIFLGDMLSAGYAVDDDDKFGTYVSRFHSLFPIPRGTVAYYVPGNTDVGLGVSSQFTRYVRERYCTHFGSLNREVRVANHSLVILDAPGLVDEDYLRAGQSVPFDQWQPIPHGPIDFVRRTSGLLRERHHDNLASEPVILLTHIPLHRAESKRCGPLREKGSIRRGVGKGWQATLGKDTSRFLLETLQPTAAFSADDRDYCEITHALLAKGEEIREITVKSFSPSRHIKRPGFQLLSLLPSESHPRHVSLPYFLPPVTLPIASVYFPFLTIHVIISLIVAIRIPQRRAKAFVSPLPISAVDSSIAFSNLHAPTSQAARSIKSYLGSHAIAPSLTAPPSKGSISGEKTHDGRTGSDDLRSSLSFIPVPDGALPYGYSSRANAVRRPRLRVPVTDVGRTEHPKWTWTFTFRGQRRRFAIQVPAWLYPLKNVGGRENVWRAIWRDLRRTLWIPFGLWALLLWWYS